MKLDGGAAGHKETMMGKWRTWHLMERTDGSVSLYYTRPDDPAQHVVYDTLDTPTPSLLARAEAAEAEVARLREARTLLSEVYNAFGHTWPQRYVEDVGAFLETSSLDAAGG
jgi:hypothetical protein